MPKPERTLFVDLDAIEPEKVFASGGATPLVEQIEQEARAIETGISTAKARGAIASLARKVASTKTGLDEIGKDHVAALKDKAKVVDAERKFIRDRLDALRDEVRKPLDDYEAREEQRIGEHESALSEIDALAQFEIDAPEPTAADIQDRIDRLNTIGGNRDWEEFARRADKARDEARAKLATMLETAKRRDAEREELERLRAADTERQQRERDAEIAKEAEAKAKREADAEVAAANERARKAEEEAANAAAAERQRIANEQAAAKAEDERRAKNRRHSAKINNEAKSSLMTAGDISEDQATAIVRAIAKGEVAHVSISY